MTQINSNKSLPQKVKEAPKNFKLVSPKKVNCGEAEEYEGLSYKASKATPINDEKEESCQKKSIDKDFRVKYKTEQCKFYGMNKECKFGESVNKYFDLVCLRSWALRYTR